MSPLTLDVAYRHNSSLSHLHDPIGQRRRILPVMGDIDRRQAERALQGVELAVPRRYGVLGAKAAWRSRLRGPRTLEPPVEITGPDRCRASGVTTTRSPRPRSNLLWAQLMQRSFGFDV